MARTAGSFAIIGGLAALVWAQNSGCDPEPEPAQYSDVLEQVSSGVVQPKLTAFRTDANALLDAVAAWEGGGDRAAAQDAWRVAMESWHEVDPLRIGPLGPSVSALGGQDRIEAIYSWPERNDCLVDQNTIAGEFSEPDWFETVRGNAYGLDELGYLLFAGVDNACPPQIPINADGSWDALGPAGIEAARSDYAVTLASKVAVDAEAALAAWEDFSLDADTYGDERDALNAVFDALFSLELVVADEKLAEPFGERDCLENCLELVEGRGRGEGSHVWLAANLRGLRDLYTGADGPGLDDILVDQGDDVLAAEFLASLDAAVVAAEAVDRPLDVLFTEDSVAALGLLATVRVAADLLEDDVVIALSLQIPVDSGGDLD